MDERLSFLLEEGSGIEFVEGGCVCELCTIEVGVVGCALFLFANFE